MTEKPIKLSDTARAMLTLAATRGDHLVRPPILPAAAARGPMRATAVPTWKPLLPPCAKRSGPARPIPSARGHARRGR